MGKESIRKIIIDSIEVKKKVQETLLEEIERAAELCIETLKKGNTVFICGNGGSAADSQHFAAELVCTFMGERKGLPAIALSTNTSSITAWSNDFSFDTVFSRQIEALGKKGDLLIGISTSGNSANVISAIEKAEEKRLKTIALLGKDGGKTSAGIRIIIPSENTARIQESHIMVIHILCDLIDDEFKN